jgi:hypothetical protein
LIAIYCSLIAMQVARRVSGSLEWPKREQT